MQYIHTYLLHRLKFEPEFQLNCIQQIVVDVYKIYSKQLQHNIERNAQRMKLENIANNLRL